MARFSKALIKAINQHLSMRDLLDEQGTDVPFNGLVFCPFHLHHHSTKSAKVYGQDNGNCLYCFSEQRTYRPFDVVLLLSMTPQEIRLRLPSDAISVDDLEGATPSLRLPVVDGISMREYKESGDLLEYLQILDQYWQGRETLRCHEFTRRTR